ncbi:MAG: hypothetical protein J6X62_06390 [Bacteroidales bacterium]|nr:hypothetical protein [Bacteroidales bacterium]
MKRYNLLIVLWMLVLPMAAKCQIPEAAIDQPRVADYGMTGPVREMTEHRSANGGNDIESVTSYSFDRDGSLSSMKKQGFGGEKTTKYPQKHPYFELTDTSTRTTYRFGKNESTGQNYMTQRTVKEADGDVSALYRYSMTGRITQSVHYVYAAGGALAASIQYEYGDDGGVTGRRLTSYTKSGKPERVQGYSVDERLLMEETYSYDRQDNVVKRVQRFYDQGGTKPRETVETRKYEYDGRGNWTKQRYSLNGKELYLYEREIRYY